MTFERKVHFKHVLSMMMTGENFVHMTKARKALPSYLMS